MDIIPSLQTWLLTDKGTHQGSRELPELGGPQDLEGNSAVPHRLPPLTVNLHCLKG